MRKEALNQQKKTARQGKADDDDDDDEMSNLVARITALKIKGMNKDIKKYKTLNYGKYRLFGYILYKNIIKLVVAGPRGGLSFATIENNRAVIGRCVPSVERSLIVQIEMDDEDSD